MSVPYFNPRLRPRYLPVCLAVGEDTSRSVLLMDEFYDDFSQTLISSSHHAPRGVAWHQLNSRVTGFTRAISLSGDSSWCQHCCWSVLMVSKSCVHLSLEKNKTAFRISEIYLFACTGLFSSSQIQEKCGCLFASFWALNSKSIPMTITMTYSFLSNMLSAKQCCT